MTAAEQLAAALARVIAEAVEQATAHPTNAAMTTAAAAKHLGFDPTYVVRLAKRGEIASTGTGHARRFLMADLEAYRRRYRNPGRVVSLTEDRTATAAH